MFSSSLRIALARNKHPKIACLPGLMDQWISWVSHDPRLDKRGRRPPRHRLMLLRMIILGSVVARLK